MKVKYWFLLLATQSVWASSYVAMKMALVELPFSLVIFLRYGLVSLFFLAYWMVKGFPKVTPRLLGLSALIGFLTFYGSQFFQLHGLAHTQAMDVSILIMFEPMITVIMAFFILKERITKDLWIVLGISMFGFVLISDVSFEPSSTSWSSIRLWGNFLFLMALFFEALCSVCGKYFTKHNHAFDAMGLLMVFGGIGTGLLHYPTVVSFAYGDVSPRVWYAILFLAIGCSIFSYTAWYYAISKVRVQYVALSLFIQPIVGSIVGYLILHERLSLQSFIGAICIAMGLLWWQSQKKQSGQDPDPNPNQQYPQHI